MKKQLLFIASFLFVSTMTFAQAIITTGAEDDKFIMVSPLATVASTGTAATISEAPATPNRTQIVADVAGSSDVAGTFDLVAQTSSDSVEGTISFNFRKYNGNTLAIKITVGTETPQTFTYNETDGGTSLYQALTATYAGTVTFSTTPTPIKFEVIDLDLGTSESVTAIRVYNFNVIDKVVPVDPVDNLNPVAVLDAGNEWYHNYDTNTFTLTLNQVEGGVFDEQALAVTTPTTTGNSSPQVAKFTKGENLHSQLRFQLPAIITTANQSSAIFKIRAYIPSTNTAPTVGSRLRVFLRDGIETAGQKNATVDVTVFDAWQEYTFDFTGTTLTEGISYSTVNLLFDQPDTDLLSTGNVYYLDAFQGPSSATLPVDHIELDDVSIGLYPNPVANSFKIDSSINIESVELYTISGSLLKTFAVQASYDISNLANGIYIVNIKTSTGTDILKIVKE